MSDKERDELDGLLSWAKELADPDWCLSVPAVAKTALIQLVTVIENTKPRTITAPESKPGKPLVLALHLLVSRPGPITKEELRLLLIEHSELADVLPKREPATFLHEPAQ